MTKAVVLLSGGQDSTTSLFLARMLYDEVHAVSVHYGQRHEAELDAARRVGQMAGVATHAFLDLGILAVLGGSALVDGGALTADGGHADAEAPNGLPSSFVPARNVFLLTAAAAVAVKQGAKDVVTGVCQTDFSGYPDCRRSFVDALEVALTAGLPSSCGPLRIATPLMWMTKAETVHLARRLPGCWEALAWTVTCYEGARPGCGTCAACVLRARGFAEAGYPDPAQAPG